MRKRILRAMGMTAAIVVGLFVGCSSLKPGTRTLDENYSTIEEFMKNDEFRRANEETIQLAFKLGSETVNRAKCVPWKGTKCTVYGLCCVSCDDSRCIKN